MTGGGCYGFLIAGAGSGKETLSLTNDYDDSSNSIEELAFIQSGIFTSNIFFLFFFIFGIWLLSLLILS